MKFWKDFWTCDSHHQAINFALKKFSKVNFQASHSHLRVSILPCLARCNASFPYFCASLPLPRVLWRTLPLFVQLLDVSRREMGKLCRAAVKTRGSMEKKRYNAGNRAGYSATLDGAGMAVLNPRASGNGAHLLDVSKCARGGARLCV